MLQLFIHGNKRQLQRQPYQQTFSATFSNNPVVFFALDGLETIRNQNFHLRLSIQHLGMTAMTGVHDINRWTDRNINKKNQEISFNSLSVMFRENAVFTFEVRNPVYVGQGRKYS